MRHRLISPGCERFVPFAESCVTRLKKLGLPYASQSFIVEGVSIKVIVRPGHEYIKLEGGCQLGIDSGVVDLRSMFSEFDDYWGAIVLHATDAEGSYLSNFTEFTSGSPADESLPGFYTNPTKAKQVAGLVTFSPTPKGKLPPRGGATWSRAFAPRVDADETGFWRYVTRDGTVASKKEVVNYCPASIFTGRCRTFVQAVYGAYMYADPHSADTSYMPIRQKITPLVAPRVSIDPYVRPAVDGVTPEYPEIILTTSSGVFLDTQTGEHWLINPSDTPDIYIYPLVSNTCAEKLRMYLATGNSANAAGLSQTDVARIESYILAYSLPDAANAQHLSVSGSEHSAWAMGYGWHWNYRGDTADRVISKPYRQIRPDVWPYPSDPDYDPWGVESVHSRLAVSRASAADGGEVSFSITSSTVSAAERWAVDRGLIIILEPAWMPAIGGGTIKSTPRLTVPFTSSATFYAFYKLDELQLCRIVVQTVEAVDATLESSAPEYATATPDGLGNLDVYYFFRSYGLNDGFATHTSKQGKHFNVSLTVGGATHGPLPLGQHKDGEKYKMSQKHLVGPPLTWGAGVVMLSGSYAITDPYDESIFIEVPLEDLSAVAGRSREVQNAYGQPVTYDLEQFAFSEDVSSYSVVAVASYDAEAVFIQSSTKRISYVSGYIKTTVSSPNFAGAHRYNDITVTGTTYGDPVYYYTWADETGTILTPLFADPTTETTPVFKSSLLVCRMGALICADDWDLSPTVFDRNADYCFELFKTVTGAAATVAIPQAKFLAPQGISQTIVTPAIIGYA